MAFDCQELKGLLTYLLTYALPEDLHAVADSPDFRQQLKAHILFLYIRLVLISLCLTFDSVFPTD